MTRSLCGAILAGLCSFAPSACDRSETRDKAKQPSDEGCDANLLAKGIEEAKAARGAHPAWFGDLSKDRALGLTLARTKLIAACPALPPELMWRLDVYVNSSKPSDSMSVSVGVPAPAVRKAFKKRRDATCADPSIFAELPKLEPDKRGPTLNERCKFQDVGLGDLTDPSLDRVSFLGLMLYQHLLDEKVDPSLARGVIEMLIYPNLQSQIEMEIPRTRETKSAMGSGVLVRLTPEAIELPGGPTIPVADATPETVADWLGKETEQAHPSNELAGVSVIVETTGAAPATGLATIEAAATARKLNVVELLIKDDRGYFGAHLVTLRTTFDASKPTYHLGVDENRLEVASTGPKSEVVLTEPLADAPRGVAKWAASLDKYEGVALSIGTRGLTVQQVLDLQLALRGADCNLAAQTRGDIPSEDCFISDLSLVTFSEPAAVLE